MLNRIRRAALHHQAEQLAQWRRTSGMAFRNEFVALLPMLAPLIPGIVGQPHCGGSVFLDWICPCKQMLPRMFALLEMDGFQDICEAMVADWEAKHREWRHVDQRSLPPPPKKNCSKQLSCLEAGVCICKEHGGKVHSFKLWLDDAMKAMAKSAELHSLIDQVSIVLRFERYLVAPGDPEVGADAAERSPS